MKDETVSTTPYISLQDPSASGDKFRSVLFLNTVQSLFSALSALTYLTLTKRGQGCSWWNIVGLPDETRRNAHKKKDDYDERERRPNGLGLKLDPGVASTPPTSAQALLKSYAFISLVSSAASPFGFLSLSHISFPTLLLGKSCKLVPVMLMNVVLYRRKFPLHKYVVVGMVTLGIYVFMAFKSSKGGAKAGPESSSMLGLVLLSVNLILDGVVNSTQDEVFARHKVEGPQMMLFMNIFSTCITTAALLFPTALTPALLVPTPPPSTLGTPFNALTAVLDFIASHPAVLQDILLFSLAGAIGQLFIFLTLSLYGSLTLVTITVTRKMMTMLLSVFLFDHAMSGGQWLGVGTVFAGIAVEAEYKRRETTLKRKRKANLE